VAKDDTTQALAIRVVEARKIASSHTGSGSVTELNCPPSVFHWPGLLSVHPGINPPEKAAGIIAHWRRSPESFGENQAYSSITSTVCPRNYATLQPQEPMVSTACSLSFFT
jgi:hypothetical protein